VLVAQNSLDDAEAVVQRIVAAEAEAEAGSAEFYLGRIAEARGDTPGAIAFYEQSLRANPDSTTALQALASLSLASGDADRAIEILREFVERNPDQARARMLLGNALVQAQDRRAAESEFRRVIEDQPGMSAAYVNLATLYDDDSVARYDILRQGMTANPDDFRLAVRLGLEYERHGRFDDAIDAYEEALALNPDNRYVANNLAMLLLDRRTDESGYRRAVELAQQFARSEEPNELDTVGWAYYRTGEYPAAVRALQRAVASAGDVAVLRYHLGMAYLAAGDSVRAREELSAAVAAGEAFPGLEDARTALAELQAQ